MTERRNVVDRYRVVIVPSGRRFRRWRWVCEEETAKGWDAVRSGYSFTRGGARSIATTRLTPYMEVHREEALFAVAWSYVPDEPKPSPVPAEILS